MHLYATSTKFKLCRDCLPGLNQYLTRFNASCSRTQRSEADEGWTCILLVSIQVLYHWATALPIKLSFYSLYNSFPIQNNGKQLQFLLLTYVGKLMQYNCVLHTKSIYPTKFQVNTATNIEVIRQNVFSHARVMVIYVSSYLKYIFFSCWGGQRAWTKTLAR